MVYTVCSECEGEKFYLEKNNVGDGFVLHCDDCGRTMGLIDTAELDYYENYKTKEKSEYVTFCYVCKIYRDSGQFRPDAEIQSCVECAKKEFDRLSAKGILNLRSDEHKAIRDYDKTHQFFLSKEVA